MAKKKQDSKPLSNLVGLKGITGGNVGLKPTAMDIKSKKKTGSKPAPKQTAKKQPVKPKITDVKVVKTKDGVVKTYTSQIPGSRASGAQRITKVYDNKGNLISAKGRTALDPNTGTRITTTYDVNKLTRNAAKNRKPSTTTAANKTLPEVKVTANKPKPISAPKGSTKPNASSSNKPSTTKAKTGSTAKKSTTTTKPVAAKPAPAAKVNNGSVIPGVNYPGTKPEDTTPRLATKKVTSVGSAPTATIEAPKTSSTVLSEKALNSTAAKGVKELLKTANNINTVAQATKAVAPEGIAPEQKAKLKDRIKSLFNKSK